MSMPLREEKKDRKHWKKGLPEKILAFAGDVSLEETNIAMIDFAKKKYGHFDILINNVGLTDSFGRGTGC